MFRAGNLGPAVLRCGVVLALLLGGLGFPPNSPAERRHARHWALYWHDEFNGPANTRPDPAKWTSDIGTGGDNRGWGNRELEAYTDSIDNAFLDGDGHLVIRALRSDDGGYTSARLKTRNRFSFLYGRAEARIKIPYAKGIWPAFWMLGNTYPRVPWPRSGEIDVTENFGEANGDRARNHSAIHGPGYAGAGIAGAYHCPADCALSDDFHLYAVEWARGRVEFYVDGVSYLKVTPADLPPRSKWVFDSTAFFLLLNVAVGGSPAPVGYPDSETPFPQDMLVDYVRVFQLRE